jgi:hypothetical protein
MIYNFVLLRGWRMNVWSWIVAVRVVWTVYFVVFISVHQYDWSNTDMHPYTCIFSNLIRTSFCRFLKRKKKLVRVSNPHLSFNRPLRATPSEVARWVSAVWKAIPESIIVRSFKKCCISNALDRSEDDILWKNNGKIKTIVTGWQFMIQLWVMTVRLMNNKLLYCSYGTYSGSSFFQNPALDRESNLYAILIRIWLFSPLKP